MSVGRRSLLVAIGAVGLAGAHARPSGASQAVRSAGLGFTPSGASRRYDSQRDIPADSLRLSRFATFGQAVDSARRAKAALVVDRDMTLGLADLSCGNVALYGEGRVTLRYGGPAPVSNTPCLMYAVDGDLIARGVCFEGFGDVFGGCAGTVERGYGAFGFQTSKAYGFARCAPRGMLSGIAGVGLELSKALYPRKLGVEGPRVDLSDSRFINCERVLHLQSDTLHFGPIRVDRVECVGTWGIVDQNCTVVADTFAFNVIYRDCIGPRKQPENNCHGMHTAFKLGVNKSIDWSVRGVKIRIENCEFYNIIDGNTRNDSDVNSAVGVDIRNTLAYNIRSDEKGRVASCDVVVGYNKFDGMLGEHGNEDCNAIYAKCFGIVIEGNRLSRCGAKDARSTGGGDGSEATGVLLKDPWGGYAQAVDRGAFIAVRGNVFADMPSNPSSKTGPMFVVKISDAAPIPVYITENVFERTDIIDPGGSFALIRTHGPCGDLIIAKNHARDCALAPNHFIYLNSFALSPGKRAVIDNNTVAGKSQSGVTTNVQMIYVDGASARVEVSGNQVLSDMGAFAATVGFRSGP